MTHPLDNIFWNSLSGPHLHFSTGTDAARRYAAGFSPIVGFPDKMNPDFDALAPFCEPGDQFYCDAWTGAAPPGWSIAFESTMVRMVWDAPMPPGDEAPDAVPLGAEHAERALELATMMRPGPFGLRTIELGDYFGYFDGERLMAMAGERTCAAGHREISGVCTHPDYQGRGLARKLTLKLVRRMLQRGETPFLHVMSSNAAAHRLYRQMGFRDWCETPVRVVVRDF
jgi:GNAT superfamily N-acetyltransferase